MKDSNTRLVIIHRGRCDVLADGLNAEETARVFAELNHSGITDIVIASKDLEWDGPEPEESRDLIE